MTDDVQSRELTPKTPKTEDTLKTKTKMKVFLLCGYLLIIGAIAVTIVVLSRNRGLFLGQSVLMVRKELSTHQIDAINSVADDSIRFFVEHKQSHKLLHIDALGGSLEEAVEKANQVSSNILAQLPASHVRPLELADISRVRHPSISLGRLLLWWGVCCIVAFLGGTLVCHGLCFTSIRNEESRRSLSEVQGLGSSSDFKCLFCKATKPPMASLFELQMKEPDKIFTAGNWRTTWRGATHSVFLPICSNCEHTDAKGKHIVKRVTREISTVFALMTGLLAVCAIESTHIGVPHALALCLALLVFLFAFPLLGETVAFMFRYKHKPWTNFNISYQEIPECRENWEMGYREVFRKDTESTIRIMFP